jgi:hypothetical protein
LLLQGCFNGDQRKWEVLYLKKLATIMLVALMMLFTAAHAFASENATEETVAKEVAAVENATEEANETVNAESKAPAAEEHAESAEPAKNTTEPAPGFESVFAIAGLLAVSSLVLGKKE